MELNMCNAAIAISPPLCAQPPTSAQSRRHSVKATTALIVFIKLLPSPASSSLKRLCMSSLRVPIPLNSSRLQRQICINNNKHQASAITIPTALPPHEITKLGQHSCIGPIFLAWHSWNPRTFAPNSRSEGRTIPHGHDIDIILYIPHHNAT